MSRSVFNERIATILRDYAELLRRQDASPLRINACLRAAQTPLVLCFYDGEHGKDQCTVVKESRGALASVRVVRGSETECRRPLLADG